jgi:hypothetical protein
MLDLIKNRFEKVTRNPVMCEMSVNVRKMLRLIVFLLRCVQARKRYLDRVRRTMSQSTVTDRSIA